MSELILSTHTPISLPAARVNITIRPGTLDDVPFMDALQRTTTKQVGWMPRAQFEGKIAAGHVLVAERVASCQLLVASEGERSTSSLATDNWQLATTPVGYLIGNDRYFKRDDVGIVYQINVLPEYRRHLVAGQLLKAQFERSAYGCRLYCCWCAQDIEANRFWAAMGFVPLAFRSGSRAKDRVHIFWQKRIRAGDVTSPWWFPSQTSGGSIREDRLVLPIPPWMKWSDEMPRVLPERVEESAAMAQLDGPAGDAGAAMDESPQPRKKRSRKTEPAAVVPVVKAKTSRFQSVEAGGMRFGPRPAAVAATAPISVDVPKPAKKPRVKKKNDAAHVAAARELRDRYLDEVNTGRHTIEVGGAKYELARSEPPSGIAAVQALSAAA